MEKSYIVGGIAMRWPIMIGAGFAKYPRDLLSLIGQDVPLGAYVVGSLTPEPRHQNEGAVLQWPLSWREFLDVGGGLNSRGMPNIGEKEGIETLETVPLDRPTLVSHAGFSPNQYAESMCMADESVSVAGHEANASCGNTGKPPMCYQLDATADTLRAIHAEVARGHLTKPIWWKLAPLITEKRRDQLALAYPRFNFDETLTVPEGYAKQYVRLLLQYPFIKAFVACNTLPGCRAFGEDGRPVTSPYEGRAGLSGPIVKEISHELIRQIVSWLAPWEHVDLVASGGNLTGDDVVDTLQAGASAVQCTSGPVWHPQAARFFADFLASSRFVDWFADDFR